MQQYGHSGHYKVDKFLIKIYTFHNIIIRIQTSSRDDLVDPNGHVPFTYIDASSVGRCYMTKHAGKYRHTGCTRRNVPDNGQRSLKL